MLAVGHMSVAYLLTKGLKRSRWKSMSIPLVWVFSLLPDLDLLIPQIRHMGPTHSIIFAIAAFLPFYFYKGKEVEPYFLSYASHTVLGDMITNRGVWFLWPLSRRRFFLPIRSRAFSTHFELALFGFFLFVFILTRDYAGGFYSNKTRILCLIPFTALLVPLVFGFPVSVPPRLILPHFVLMIVVLQPFYPSSWMHSRAHAD
jgi:membrane-bound metal-dependent hydrolase YbcI (DUF457 family)